MGRLPDPPGLQQAKGNPGRRRSAAAKRIEASERVAELLARAPVEGDPLAPPRIIEQGASAAAAVAVWRELAPRLASTQRLQPSHRLMFATFCVYFAEWVISNEDIAAKGLVQNVKTVAGGVMERIRPMVTIRDHAFERVIKLSGLFGLTPSDEYAVFKDQALAAVQNPGLFDGPARHRGAADESRNDPEGSGVDPHTRGAGSVVGSLDSLDSPPPGSPLN